MIVHNEVKKSRQLILIAADARCNLGISITTSEEAMTKAARFLFEYEVDKYILYGWMTAVFEE